MQYTVSQISTVQETVASISCRDLCSHLIRFVQLFFLWHVIIRCLNSYSILEQYCIRIKVQETVTRRSNICYTHWRISGLSQSYAFTIHLCCGLLVSPVHSATYGSCSPFMFIAQDIKCDIVQGIIKIDSDYHLWIHLRMWMESWVYLFTHLGWDKYLVYSNVRQHSNMFYPILVHINTVFCTISQRLVSCKNCPIKYIRSK